MLSSQPPVPDAPDELLEARCSAITASGWAHYKHRSARSTPKVITEGTLAYGLVFPSGFTAVLIGSAGPITPGVRALAEKLGPVDVAIVAYQVHGVADTQIGYTWPFIELFKPKLFLPAHHDAAPPAWIDLGLEPLFDKILQRYAEHRVSSAALSFADLRRGRWARQRQSRIVQILDGIHSLGRQRNTSTSPARIKDSSSRNTEVG